MKRIIIKSNIEILDFPKMKVNDEKFFGFPVAIGVHPSDNTMESCSYIWCDFCYGDDIKRYKLPEDESLIDGIWRYLKANMMWDEFGTCCKIWIKKTKDGYETDLP